MSDFYKPTRSRNIYDPKAKAPFKLSRSKIDLFLNCPRCFYLDRRLGVGQPPGFPFNLNTAVDTLLKKEFDIHRAAAKAHPLMKAYALDLVPYESDLLNEWRQNFKGIQYLHPKTNFIVTGAVDDIWSDRGGKLHVVDYKSTSKETEVTLDAPWQIGYKRQMEVYQWLLRQIGYEVSDTGYFVYCNGRTDRAAFDAKLEFDVKIIPYTGRADWIDQALIDARKCLSAAKLPKSGADCDFCNYVTARTKVEK